ncbi:hypothetical protein [Moorena sp. SIO3I6]|uniref:SDH family Clp fold serine proteinase n=1 Tax=Moorena sp. SIO3I6 TaxID=2607831 RepID=UPI0034509B69
MNFSFNFFDLFWIFLIISSLQPLWQRRQMQYRRFRALQEFEHKRKSRLILLIHRQESISLFGIPVSRYISIEDSEQVLRAIRLTPPDVPIDLILHTPGGLVLATEQIARALILDTPHGYKPGDSWFIDPSCSTRPEPGRVEDRSPQAF